MNREDLDYLSASLRKTVRSEIRIAGVLDAPSVNPLPADLDAEDQVIAAAREGHFVEGFDPRMFSRSLHAMLWVVLVEAHKLGQELTTERAVDVLTRDGWKGSGLREEVERLFDWTGFCRPELAAHRVARSAKLRRICQHAQRLEALARTGADLSELASVATDIAEEVCE